MEHIVECCCITSYDKIYPYAQLLKQDNIIEPNLKQFMHKYVLQYS
jgi:hypothetical protein